MKRQLPSLQALKLAQLKRIAIQCGISSSGTKPVLTSRIEEELRGSKNDFTRRNGGNNTPPRGRIDDHKQRILSIDMGIRNLAYCLFDRPARSSTGKLPIRAWKCISVSPRPAKQRPSSSSSSTTTTTTAKTKESFEPSIYAHYAYTFLSSIIHSHRPTKVLIERQRYRSMSSSAVQEWTVRVNMFEGMLYAVLRTLAEEGKWSGVVHGVSPLKVTSYWVEDDDKDMSSKAKTAKARNKAAKVDLVGNWLERNAVIECYTEEAKRTADIYLEKWKGKGRRKRKNKGDDRPVEQEDDEDDAEGITKLDDQADCLLQAVAWLRWEENKLRVLTDGIEALDGVRSGH